MPIARLVPEARRAELAELFARADDVGHRRFECERDLSTTQRMFLSLANPSWALEKAGQYWRSYSARRPRSTG